MKKPDDAAQMLKPPEGAVRLRRFLANASRQLVLYSLPLFPLAFVLSIVIGVHWATMLLWATPALCWMVALGMAVVRSFIPSFLRFSLSGMMILIWSAGLCISAIVAGAQSEHPWLLGAGSIGLLIWGTTVLFFVVNKELRYDWPDD